MFYLLVILSLSTSNIFASYTPNFTDRFVLQKGKSRENIYKLDPVSHRMAVSIGRQHALSYPVKITGLKLPYDFLSDALKREIKGPGGNILNQFMKQFSPWQDIEDMYDWLGLSKYPNFNDTTTNVFSPYALPDKNVLGVNYLGATIFYSGGERALTFSCGACHVGNLFGRPVVGLSTRFPRAFDFIGMGVKARSIMKPRILDKLIHLNESEREMISDNFESLKYIKTKKTIHPSLDSSLAIVGLSLSKRKPDAYASRDPKHARVPRPNPLNHQPVDSKPSVWWNLKYKTRWLSDGSVVSGNPIFTNILWNEIGRGVDLKTLEHWLKTNNDIIRNLTSFVFATRSPRWTDFFSTLDIAKAEKGRKLFNTGCNGCHGTYVKNWQYINQINWATSPIEKLTETKSVIYHERTPVVDVGTDPNRYKGTKYFADDLNRLHLSKKFNTKVKPQVGYVPPPLVGIWARWPYFHNNSVPSLCELLTPDTERKTSYLGVKAKNKTRDFDVDCVGYPHPSKLTDRIDAIKYDSSNEGMSNSGHTEGILIRNGQELYTKQQKTELIEFLKTL